MRIDAHYHCYKLPLITRAQDFNYSSNFSINSINNIEARQDTPPSSTPFLCAVFFVLFVPQGNNVFLLKINWKHPTDDLAMPE